MATFEPDIWFPSIGNIYGRYAAKCHGAAHCHRQADLLVLILGDFSECRRGPVSR